MPKSGGRIPSRLYPRMNLSGTSAKVPSRRVQLARLVAGDGITGADLSGYCLRRSESPQSFAIACVLTALGPKIEEHHSGEIRSATDTRFIARPTGASSDRNPLDGLDRPRGRTLTRLARALSSGVAGSSSKPAARRSKVHDRGSTAYGEGPPAQGQFHWRKSASEMSPRLRSSFTMSGPPVPTVVA